MLTFIIFLLLVGLIAGAIARFLVPGKDSMGLLGTIGVGVVGSLIICPSSVREFDGHPALADGIQP